MHCDEVIFSIRDYDTAFFDYNCAQKLYRELFNLVDRVAFFGTESDSRLGTPKQYITRTIESLKEARYHMPTHFFHDDDLWLDASRELQLLPMKISRLPNVDSNLIIKSIMDGTDYWQDKVPYRLIDSIKTYIATKNRNF
jgi:hypothetical protein